MFVESFQGQYKDGTNGTRDFRMVSASFLILRILILFSFLPPHHQCTWTSSKLQSGFFVVVSRLYAFMRPYKQNFRNNVDTFMLGLLAILSLTFLSGTNYPGSNSSTLSVLLTTLLLGVPHMVLMFYTCYMLSKKAGITQWLKKNFKTLKRCLLATNQLEAGVEAEPGTSSLPDWLLNPEECEPLLPPEKNTQLLSTQKSQSIKNQES